MVKTVVNYEGVGDVSSFFGGCPRNVGGYEIRRPSFPPILLFQRSMTAVAALVPWYGTRCNVPRKMILGTEKKA